MDNKKDIGKLFKERLDNLESKPNDAIWGALEKELQKEKRRFLPLWARLSMLLLLVSIGSIALYNYATDANGIDNNTNSTSTSVNSKDTTKNNINKDASTSTTLENINALDSINTTINNQQNNDSFLTSSQLKTQALTNTSKQNILKSTLKNKNTTSTFNTNNSSNKQSTVGTKTNSKSPKSYKKQSLVSTTTNLKSTKSSNTYRTLPTLNNSIEGTTSLTVFNSLGMVDLSNAKITTSLIPFGNDTKDKIASIETDNNYSIETFGGPLFLSANGSSLDNRLDENKKTTNVSFTYGAAINYNLSEKSSIRFGVANTELTHITENVTSTNTEGNVISLNNIVGLTIDFNALETLNATNLLGSETTISLRQELSYLEIPVEINYQVISKKIALDVFGGVSLLSLNDNRVFVESSNGYSTFIGRANNLNKVNLSFNTGATISTKLFNKTDLNIRPTVRYYFKTIGKRTLNFNPFSYGISLGLRYSF